MKTGIYFTALLALLIAGVAFRSSTQFQPIAVIELFTSQGCSSCPSADRLLSQTINDAKVNGKKIFALSFHVDYWNRLGWKDPFSSMEYSQRQSDYASLMNLTSVYTPQMIVNGNRELIGSDEVNLKDAILESLKATPAAAFKTLSATIQNAHPPVLNYSLDGNYTNCKINFALVSVTETTYIKKGENGGRTLTNENVVRQFVSIPATKEGEITFKSSPVPSVNNLAIVAYIQNLNDSKIIGAALAEIIEK